VKLAAIETATAIGGVALLDDDRLVAELRVGPERGLGERLVALLDRALADGGLRLDDLDAIAVSIGPGSYTGIRIGVAVAKGLALGAPVRLAAVSSLETLAVGATGAAGLVCPVIDAKKGQLYAALFRRAPDGLERATADLVLTAEQLTQRIVAEPEAEVLLLGDGLERYAEALERRLGSRARFAPRAHWYPRPELTGRVGRAQLVLGRTVAARDLEPVYLRPAEAEYSRARSAIREK
jgi:tRNA threonylcarbamoyladenosine biosynthesis protein TsaB